MELLAYLVIKLLYIEATNCDFRLALISKGYAVSEEECNRHLSKVILYSRIHNIPADLIIAKIVVESGFRETAMSKDRAKGLLQVTSIARKDLGSLFIEDDLLIGILYFKKLLNKYKNEDLALAAYNAGQGKVARHKGIPPFKETINHIKRVKEVRNLISLNYPLKRIY